MPTNNIANPGKQVDPSERTIDGAQNLQAEELSADDEQDGSVLDEADDSGGVGTE
ncbi:MAG: hypothetical protein QOJ76_3510 [Acidobacteriota bacterium]|jgi:hypothetical protein|nr:hypothetical protein [Acidobacteriota bacterium]